MIYFARYYWSVTWLLFLGYEFILSEANLSYEAKPSAINLPNLNINSYPKNMSPCNDFITYFCVDKMNIFTHLSLYTRYPPDTNNYSVSNQPITAREINQVCDNTIYAHAN